MTNIREKEPDPLIVVGTLLLTYLLALIFCGGVLHFMAVDTGLIVAFLFGMFLSHIARIIGRIYRQIKEIPRGTN